MAAAPAQVAAVAGRGAIVVGNAADFAVFAPDEQFVVDPAKLAHKNPITPYAARTLTGSVHSTWLAGVPVSGQINDGGGRLITRGDG
jgi:allantoinase